MDYAKNEVKSQKSLKSRSDNAVQGTNDSSIVSKCSMSKLGYFWDDFLPHFVAKTQRRSPLINRGYFIRAAAIDQSLKAFLNLCTRHKQIISLGSGFDSSFFRLKHLNFLGDATYFEVDFPELVRRKAALIGLSDDLKTLIGQTVPGSAEAVISGHDYKLIGVDLTQLAVVQRCLKDCGIDWHAPTLFLSEVVMTYMAPERSSAVIEWAASRFENAIFVTYEQLRPDDAFGQVMMNHFVKLGSPLKAIKHFPTESAQRQRYITKGWTDCYTTDMNNFWFSSLSKVERDRISMLEVFDEFEEWHLKCSHYMLLWSVKGLCCELRPLWSCDWGHGSPVNQEICAIIDEEWTLPKISQVLSQCSVSDALPSKASLKRFGLASCVLVEENILLVHGGFGDEQGQHKRINTVSVISLTPLSVQGHYVCKNLDSRMFHTMTPIGDGKVIVIGGRQSPKKPCPDILLLDMGSVRTRSSLTKNTNQNVNETDSTNSGDDCHARPASVTFADDDLKCSLFVADHVNSAASQLASLVNESCSGKNKNTKLGSEAEGNSMVHLPSARWRHTATLIRRNGQHYIVVFGGRTTSETATSDCFILDVEAKSWSMISSPSNLIEARHSHTANNWEDNVLVCGGLTSDLRPLNSIFMLDTIEWVWKRMKFRSGSLIPRYSHTAHVFNNQLLIVGGVTIIPNTVPGLAVVDLNTWSVLEYCIPAHIPRYPIMLHNHTSHVIGDQLCIVGGGGNCFSFGTHLNRTPLLINISELFAPDEIKNC